MADSPENMNSSSQGNPNEEMDLDALLSSIKRVSDNKDAGKELAKEKPAAPSAPEVKPAAASPKAEAPKPETVKQETHAPENRRTEAPNAQVRRPNPAQARAQSAARRKEIEARRKRASILLAITAVVLVLAIGGGIYLAVSYLMNRETTTAATSVSGNMDSSSEQVRDTVTGEAPSSSTPESTEPSPTPTPAPTPFPAGGPDLAGYIVVIDAGHQAVPNLEQEPMSSSMGGSKDKSSEGFYGVTSGINESEINLSVELVLKAYLESLGCEVYVTRESDDVDISNKERAELAVSYNPDLYIRLYCNAANDSMASGCEVIVPSGGKYSSDLPGWGEALGNAVSAATGSAFNGCTASGNYSGLNWANSVPSFMLRMGYLTNSDDEALLLDEEYQFKICQGIAEFVATMPKH